MAKVKKLKKEEPRYKCQKQYEGEMKQSYYSMLTNMCKSVLVKTTKLEQDATITSTSAGLNGSN